MTSRFLKAGLRVMLAALIVPLLHACGGGSESGSGGNGQVRVVNATTSGTALDFYAGTTLLSSAVATNTSGSYVPLAANSYALYLNNAGSATNANGSTRTVTAAVYHTLLAYTTGGTLNTVWLTDAETAPTSGTAKFRVYNTSNEAGTLDVYVTDESVDLAAASATALGITSARLNSYSEIAKGTYRIRVTGSGDKSDLRLDISGIALADQQIATLVLTTTPGGVLVHGLLMNQQAASTSMLNPSARVRLVAGVAGNTPVAATLNGVTLSSGLTSPAIGAYALVPAGTLTSSIRLAGTAITAPAMTAPAGADLSLLVLGAATSPNVSLIADDNTPSATTTSAKMRLVNGANNLSGNVTLTANYGVVANDVSFASASAPIGVTAGDTYRLEATTPATPSALYLATGVSLQAGKVYTVFMLGDGAAAQGVLRRDR